MFRAFLALELGETIRDRYATCLGEARGRHGKLRWVRPENLHLTLRFLGDVVEERVEPLRERVAGVVLERSPFRVSLGAPGCFGRPDRPQVLWFGVEEGAAELIAVQEAIETEVRELRFPPDAKSWQPHLTVARNPRRLPFPDWGEALIGWGLAGLDFEAQAITLFSSTLSPQGPSYSVLWKAALGGAPR